MKPCVFGIDDAHWIDPDSWLFLLDLVHEPNAVLILTLRPIEKIEKKPPALMSILEHSSTEILKLEGLSLEHMVELTCRLLDVETIPDELKKIIHDKSHGVPLWCEELVETMLELDYLKIVDEESEKKAKPRKSVFVRKLQERRGSSISALPSAGADIPIPDSVTGMVLARIDHMSASEQMALKCAAVIGTVFARTMLQALIPNCNLIAFNNSLNTLAESGIIECAVAAKRKNCISEGEDMEDGSASRFECPCLENAKQGPLSAGSHKYHHSYPPIKNCTNLQFVHHYIQETVYNLCTEAQRKTLHEAAAHFLESKAHKCKNCGGGDFMSGRHSSVKKKKSISRKVYHGTSTLKARERWNSVFDDQIRRPSEEGGLSGNRNSIKLSGSGNIMLNIEMEECHCDEVLAKVYPQLVRHWRAAGDMRNTTIYLIEEASAAVATNNNMEALSLLQEASTIIEEMGNDVSVTKQELGRFQSVLGQVSVSHGAGMVAY